MMKRITIVLLILIVPMCIAISAPNNEPVSAPSNEPVSAPNKEVDAAECSREVKEAHDYCAGELYAAYSFKEARIPLVCCQSVFGMGIGNKDCIDPSFYDVHLIPFGHDLHDYCTLISPPQVAVSLVVSSGVPPSSSGMWKFSLFLSFSLFSFWIM